MLDRLESLVRRFQDLEVRLEDPFVHKDPKLFKEIMLERANLEPLVLAYRHYQDLERSIADAEAMANDSDPELKAMAREELKELEGERDRKIQEIRLLLIPKDPNDDKNIIMEIRAGTGGDEAGLFAADLFRMYSRYAESRGWRMEMLSQSETELGGLREVVVSISGRAVYSFLKFESGTHRVQRVPTTENQGRIHTSACTVAVLPEAEETDIQVLDQDLRIDVFRSSGPGGQSVNTTDSAVRITHIPSGLVVICQDEKSQIKNKAKALRVLKARLYDMEEAKRQATISEQRKSQIGSGDRSERIRTYNFPQNRLTDHRINLTLYSLDKVVAGDLDEVIHALQLDARETLLNGMED